MKRHENYLARKIHDSVSGQLICFSTILNGESISLSLKSGMPRNLSIHEQRLWKINKDDHNWRSQYISAMPDFLARYFADRYIHKFNTRGRRDANTFLRTTVGENVLPRLNMVNVQYSLSGNNELIKFFEKDFSSSRFPNCGRDDIKKLSYRVADFLYTSFVKFTEQFVTGASDSSESLTYVSYQYLATLLQGLKISAPYWNDFCNKTFCEQKAFSAIARMTSPEWWKCQLKRRRDMQREHMAIAVGQVQKSASSYVSQSCLAEWEEQKRRNRAMLKMMELENQDTGERVALIDMVDASNANPAIRRCELMIRMRGFEDIADELGYVGDFYTLTAPSKFHSAHSGGGFVKTWMGNNPRECQQYLCKIWACARAKLKRQGLSVYGFRVAEPHHDGMPHWHMLLFMLPEHRDRIRNILREYALHEDGNEPGAVEHRFTVKEIDQQKGTATGYIAKYISKNIDGYALDNETDEESGEDLKTMAKAVTAWASRWRIRQFQQIGGAPVTVWRELRRLRNTELPDSKMDAVLAAADVGDWAAYTAEQGGPLVLRKNLVVRLAYRVKESPNLYGEEVKRVNGVISPIIGDSSVVCTRPIRWKIIPKMSLCDRRESSVSGRIAAPWSSVNNCTQDFSSRLTPDLFKDTSTSAHDGNVMLNKRRDNIVDR